MPHTKEMIRQKLSLDSASGFRPTKNDRTPKMYKELITHARLIRGMQKQTARLHKATDGMLVMVTKAFTTDQPHDYQPAEVNTTQTFAEPVGTTTMSEESRVAKAEEIDNIRNTLATRLQEEVYDPSDAWLAEVKEAKYDLKDLEDARLELDAQRRRASKAEFKQVKQARNLGDNSESFKERTSSEHVKLDVARKAYEEQEEGVYQKLKLLVAKSSVIFDCMENAFKVGNDVMNQAQGCAPSTSAMGEHVLSSPVPSPAPLVPPLVPSLRPCAGQTTNGQTDAERGTIRRTVLVPSSGAGEGQTTRGHTDAEGGTIRRTVLVPSSGAGEGQTTKGQTDAERGTIRRTVVKEVVGVS